MTSSYSRQATQALSCLAAATALAIALTKAHRHLTAKTPQGDANHDKAVDRQRVLREIRKLARVDSADKIFPRVMRTLSRLIDVERASVFIVDTDATGSTTLRIASSTDATNVAIPVSCGIAGAVARGGGVVMTDDAYADPRFDRRVDEFTGFRTRTMLAVPVVVNESGSVVAVLQVLNKRGPSGEVTAFSTDDCHLLEVLACIIASLHSRASLLDASVTQRRQTEAIVAVAEAVRAPVEPQERAAAVARAVEHGCECGRVALYLLNRAERQLCCVTHADPIRGTFLQRPADEGVVGRVLATGLAVVVADVSDGSSGHDLSRDRLLGIETRSVAAVAVRRGGRTVGVIEAVNHAKGEFDHEHVRLLETTAAQVSDTIAAPLMAQILGSGGTRVDYDDLSDEETLSVHSALLSEYSDLRASTVKAAASAGQRRLQRRFSVPGPGNSQRLSLDGDATSQSLDGISERGSGRVGVGGGGGCGDGGGGDDDDGEGPGGGARRNSIASVASVGSNVSSASKESVNDESAGTWTLDNRLRSQLGGLDRATGSRLSPARRGSLAAAWSFRPRLSLSSLFDIPSSLRPEDLEGWGLDVWPLTQTELCQLAAAIFGMSGVVAHFGISAETLSSFLQVVSSRYPKNPYHNWQHAVTVLHASYLLSRAGAAQSDGVTATSHAVADGTSGQPATSARVFPLDRIHILSLLISAICHDIDHPGVSNQFLINTSAPLAICYNDSSVLENHHAATTFTILSDPANNLLASLTLEQRKEARQLICKTILSTDMAHHSDMVKSLTALAADSKPIEPVEALQAYMHLADLSNAALEPALARKWALCVVAEFRQQAAREAELGMEVAPHMRKLDTPYDIANLQVGFFDFVVLPLYKAASCIFPAVRERLPQLIENREAWFDEKSREGEKDGSRRQRSVTSPTKAGRVRSPNTTRRSGGSSAGILRAST